MTLSPITINVRAEQVINFYATAYERSYTIAEAKVLKSLSGGDDAYTLYTLEPYGYAIVLNDTNSLMQACYTPGSVPPVDVNSDDVVYYAGPNGFFTKFGENYVDILGKQVFSATELTSVSLAESMVRTNEETHTGESEQVSILNASGTVQTHSVMNFYFSNLSEFGTNTNGICTVLATAILLGFYDYFYSDEYVDELYEDGAGTNQAFYHLLNVYVYGNATPSNGGIYIRNAASKINTYLDNRSVEANFEYAYHLLVTANLTNAIINKISAGKPVVASMETIRGAEWNHTVVVYGVTYDTSNPTGTAVYTAHMGWHGDGNS